MTLIEIETSFGIVAASEQAIAEAVRDLLVLLDAPAEEAGVA
jgi:hypothetical protein